MDILHNQSDLPTRSELGNTVVDHQNQPPLQDQPTFTSALETAALNKEKVLKIQKAIRGFLQRKVRNDPIEDKAAVCAIIGSEANEDAEVFTVFIVPKMLKVTNKKVIDIEAQLGPFNW